MMTQNVKDVQAASGNKTDTVRQTIDETIEAPILSGIKTKKFCSVPAEAGDL